MGTLTILFVDQVGSTAQLSTLGDPAAADLHDRLQDVLRRHLDEHHGVYQNYTGDGLMASFESCVEAASCAVELQQALAELNRPAAGSERLILRMGLHTGEPLRREVGLYGAAVVIASRLCDQAGAGQVLVSDVVRALLEPRRSFEFEPVGARQLKGITDPVVCHLLRPALDRSDLPIELRPDRSTPFVGRDAELDRMRLAHLEAGESGARAALVTGPAGAGKSRLLREFAAEAHLHGAHVVGATPADLATVGGVTDQPGGTVVVVDDLDVDQIATVESAVARLGSSPVLVLGAVQGPVDVEASGRTIRIELDPLPEGAVRRWIASVVGGTSAELAEELISAGRRHPGAVVAELERSNQRLAADRLAASTGRARALEAEDRRTFAEVRSGLRRRRAVVAGARSGVRRADAPYKGLLAYDVDDAEDFCGRDDLTADLLARVQVGRFLAVTGSSGSGKSSVVNAGLIVSVERGVADTDGSWEVLRLTPGARPLLALAHRLVAREGGDSPDVLAERLRHRPTLLADLVARAVLDRADGSRILLVVDQAEECFTQCRDADERAAFFDALVHAARVLDGPTTVVFVLRSDYYGHCAEHAELARAAAASHFVVGAMSTSEIRSAVEEPARRHGLSVEPALVDRALDEASGQPGLLPLLSTAMLETWRRRTGDVLTLEAYEATGGVQGAIARLAESVFEGLGPDERNALRGILLRLAELGDDGDDVRRRAALDELLIDDAHRTVLDRLVSHRLVTVDVAHAEVAHEALLREWPRLRRWLEEDRSGRRLHRQLTTDAAAWSEDDHDPDRLYRGVRLQAAIDWATEHAAEVNPLERAFLDAGVDAWEQALDAERRTSRRLRVLAAGLATLLVVAAVAAGFALLERSEAQDRAAAAESARIAKLADLVLDQDPTVAALLAVEAWRAEPTVVSEGTLLTAVQRFGASQGSIPVEAFDLDTDGGDLVVLATGDEVVLWDLAAATVLDTLPIEAYSVRLSPDGSVLVALRDVFDDGPFATSVLELWDVEAGTMSARIELPSDDDAFVFPDLANQLAFLDDGRRVAFAAPERSTVWETATGDQVGELPAGIGLHVAREGDRGAVVDRSQLLIWDAVTYEVIETIPLPEPPGGTFFDPFAAASVVQGRGRELIVAVDGVVSTWDLDTGQRLADPDFEVPPGTSLEASADGTKLYTSQVVWDLAEGRPTALVDTGMPDVFADGGGAFAADGAAYVYVDFGGLGSGTVGVVPADAVANSAEIAGEIRFAAAGPDGLVTVVLDTTEVDPFVFAGLNDPIELGVALVDPRTGEVASEHSVGVGRRFVLSGDGSTIAVVDDAVTVFDVATGERLLSESIPGDDPAGTSLPGSVSLSPDGGLLAVVGGEVLRIHDVESGDELDTWEVPGAAAIAVTGAREVVVVGRPTPDQWQVAVRAVGSDDPVRIATLEVDADVGSVQAPNGDDVVLVSGRTGTYSLRLDPISLEARLTNASSAGPIVGAEGGRVLLDTFEGVQTWDLDAAQPVGRASGLFFVASRPVLLGTGEAAELVTLSTVGGHLLVDRRAVGGEALVERACELAGRELSAAEWGRYFPGQDQRTTCGP